MYVSDKITEAHEAFNQAQPKDLLTRASWLDAAGAALEHRRDTLVDVAKVDTNLPEARLQNELSRTVFQLELLATEVRGGTFLDLTVDHRDPDWGMGPRPDIRRMNVALGVVGVFGASNFPFAFSVAGGDTASALAAGCSVVHKIHEGHEELGLLTAEILTSAFVEAGAPEGIFSAVTGREAGIELVEHPLVKAVGFTGSVSGGRALFDRAMSRAEPIPFYGELGSMNPAVVSEAAWKNRSNTIIEGFIGSMTMGLGQFCTKPGLLLVPSSVVDDAKALLAEGLASHEPSGEMLNERIHDGFLEARDYVASLPGVETVVPGDDSDSPKPAVFSVSGDSVADASAVLEREIFGPAAVLISYRDQEQLLSLVDQLRGQLTGTIHSEDGEDFGMLAGALGRRCGRLLRNGWPTGVTVSYAQSHGGPYPATTSANSTSVGTGAIERFVRPLAFQDFGDNELPDELKEANPLGLRRRVDGEWTRK